MIPRINGVIIGFGNAVGTPIYQLHGSHTYTNTSGNQPFVFANPILNPAGISSASMRGMQFLVQLQGSSNLTGIHYGVLGQVQIENSATTTQAIGAFTNIIATATAGTITSAQSNFAGAAVNGGTITTMQMYYVSPPVYGGGAITNLHGLFISDMSGAGTLNRAITTGLGHVYFGDKVGLLSTTPTHSLTLGSTTTGLTYYNTADQTTNYERLTLDTSANVFRLLSEKGGSGIIRQLQLGSSGRGQIRANNTSPYVQITSGSSVASTLMDINISSFTNSTGIGVMLSITGTLSQSGSAGYDSLLINPTESSVGSGTKNLIHAQVGSVDKFTVDDTGVTNTITGYRVNGAAASGTVLRGNGTNYVGSTFTIPDTYALGDTLYASATNVLTALAGNSLNTKKFLTSTGALGSPTAPAWGTVTAADVGSGANLSVGNSMQITAGSGTAALLVAATIDTIQDIRTSATPQFAGLGINAAASSTAFVLHGAATTAKSSERIPAGTAPTSPVEGDLWNDSTAKVLDGYYAGIKQAFVGVTFIQTQNVTAAFGTVTTTETTLVGTGSGTATLPAGFFTAGKTIRVAASGYYTSGTTAKTLRIRLRIGAGGITGTVAGDTTAIATTNGLTTVLWTFEGYLTCYTTGAGGTMWAQSKFMPQTSATVSQTWPMGNTATVAVDTTTTNAISLTAQWGAGADAPPTITCTNLTIEAVNNPV